MWFARDKESNEIFFIDIFKKEVNLKTKDK